MNIDKTDKATLKALIKEIMLEDKAFLKEVIKEVLVEQEAAARREKITGLINEDFDQYDDVFKALA